MKPLAVAVALTTLGADATTSAPYLTVRGAPAKGINLAAKAGNPDEWGPTVLDPTYGGYISPPKSTHAFAYTINQDGSGARTMLIEAGRSVTNQMRIVGKLSKDAMSFTVGENGNVTLISFYPRESLVIVALTGLVGDRELIPVGSAYLSRCTYSWASP